jgi:hypothetical protein
MRLHRYNSFNESRVGYNYTSINENLDQAKKLLRDTYKFNKVLLDNTDQYQSDDTGLIIFNKEMDPIMLNDIPEELKSKVNSQLRAVKIPQEENTKLERGDIIKAVREMLGDKLGYAYLFTYLLIIEHIPIDQLKDLFSKLLEYKDLLGLKGIVDDQPLLRRPINNYIDRSINNNFENLIDDLDKINVYRATKRVIQELTPVLKNDFDKQPPVIKKQFEDIALALFNLGGGQQNKEEHERLWKLFFGELKVLPEDVTIRGVDYKKGDRVYSGQMVKYDNIREFLRAAQGYIKNSDNVNSLSFLEKVQEVNDKYGKYGADVSFNSDGIVILEIKSFQANKALNSHTRHCIKDYEGSWNSYVGAETNYNKQYYIYDFNIPSYDVKSVIGITIGPEQRVTACHAKDDSTISPSGFKDILRKMEKEYGISDDLWSYFKPMSQREIEEKRRRVLANREIVKKGLSLSEVKKILVEDGADVNIGNGQALDNAISEADPKKVKYLLDFGASPNLRTRSDASINKIGNITDDDVNPEKSKIAFEILKYMIRAGAELTPQVFKGILGDPDAVKFCLENGLDPNFEDNLAIRLAIKRGLYEVLNHLIQHGAKLGSNGVELAWAYNSKNRKVIDYIINNCKLEKFERSMQFVGHSPKLEPNEIVNALKEMQSLLDEGKFTVSDSGYVIRDTNGVVNRRATLKQVEERYGNLYNLYIEHNKDKLKLGLKKSGMSDSQIEEFLKY